MTRRLVNALDQRPVTDLHPPAKARERETLERQIMDSCIAKNDAEWWAMCEIERLRKALQKIIDADPTYTYDSSEELRAIARDAMNK